MTDNLSPQAALICGTLADDAAAMRELGIDDSVWLNMQAACDELVRLADENARLQKVAADLTFADNAALQRANERWKKAEAERDDVRRKWADAESKIADCDGDLATIVIERDALRETVKRLNRRVQVAEAGVAEKVKAQGGRSLGRALANAAADMLAHERDDAQAECDALRKRISEARIVAVDVSGDEVWLDGDDYGGQRVALVKLEDGEPTGEHADSPEAWARRKMEDGERE